MTTERVAREVTSRLLCRLLSGASVPTGRARLMLAPGPARINQDDVDRITETA